MKRRTLFVVSLLVVLIVVVVAYAIPVIRVEGCPDSWYCPAPANIPFDVSITKYFIGFGAESGSFGYWLW